MRTLHRLSGMAVAMSMVFFAGYATGQRQPPHDDQAAEQTLLATIDLARAIEGCADRQMHLARVTIAPGGHIRLHDHADDPTLVYLVSGSMTNHHDDGRTEEFSAGQAFAKFGPRSHWVENNGPAPATFVFTSVSRTP